MRSGGDVDDAEKDGGRLLSRDGVDEAIGDGVVSEWHDEGM